MRLEHVFPCAMMFGFPLVFFPQKRRILFQHIKYLLPMILIDAERLTNFLRFDYEHYTFIFIGRAENVMLINIVKKDIMAVAGKEAL